MKQHDKGAVKRYRQVWLWLVLWVAFLPATQAATDCNAVTEIPVSECQSLMELYNSTNGPNWKNHTGWNQTNTPCSWHGITCSAGHVTELTFGGNQLSGNIPNFSNLPNLTRLYLYFNQLSGSIPNFSNLPNLTWLELDINKLSGSIPNFSNLPKLGYLNLNSNQLSGSIPNFSNLPKLYNLQLSENQLSGSIPNFSNLPKLEGLHLSSNQLGGSIPNFSNLPKLGYLNLSSNQLSGSIPNFTAFTLSNLQFDFNNNCGLTAYDVAQESVLNSKTPNWQTPNPNCPVSTVTDCNAVTEIPVSECQSLMELYNSTNGPNWKNSTGWNQTNTPCSWFGVICSRAGHVNAIELSTADDFSNHDNIGNGNGLTGKIPDLNLPNLTGLSLAGNQLSGNIPNFSNLPKLTTLYLWSNQLSGNIPNFSNLPKLGHLYLWSNRLNGSIPNFNLPDLIYLYLQSNQLSGNIPNFSNLPKLEVLHLENNQLSGSIPNFTAFSLAKKYAYFNNNCGLTAYDAAQESVLNSKDPDWQKRNPNCPVSTATLTMTETGNGTVTSVPAGIDCGATCTANYSANTAVTLTAIADTGYGFSSWSEDCSGTDNVTTVTMDMDKNCTAIFTGSNQQPVASLIVTPTSGPAPLTVTLDYSASYDPDGSIVKYDWNVNGQPISVAAQQKSMTFNTQGSYTISLRVTDNDGLTGETSQIVTVTGSTLSHTLILTNSQKLATLYGPDQANQVMNKLHELANHPNVQGLVIQVENDPTVAAAYASRTNDDDNNQANAVAEAIKQVMLNQWNEQLENIVLVGDDRVIPFYRIKDGTIPPDPMTLTDDFYSDHPPINNCSGCANPQVYIPDVPSGRLLENPSQIIGVIDAFLANSTLNIGTAAVTGYDFIQDGAQEHCNTLQAIGIATNCMLIGEVWTSNDFLNQVLNTYHDVTSINGHADYSIFGTPNGFVSASDFANTTIDFSRTIFYSVGCHAGLNVANDLDLPESLAIRRANYVANTGFGWGGDGVILSEELMWNLTKYLIKPQTTLGKAFARAKQQYYADNPNFESYGEKITAESTLYGLPMYQLTSQATAPISTGISATKTQTTQENGLQKDGYAYTWAMATPIATTSGSSFYSIRGATISKDNEPILPKLTNEVTDPDKALHGIIFRGGNYKTVNATPPMQRFSTTTGHLTPEKKFVAPNWYPSVFFTPNALNLTTGKKEMLVATAGQYNPNLTTGQQRIFNNMDFDVYHHANTNDWTPPTTYLTNHNLQANTATVTVTTSDASGVKEVVVAYTDGKGTWNSANLTENGGTWTGNFAATAETEFFVQAVDKTGNVAVNDNGGEYFSFKAMSSLPALGNGFAGGIAVNSGAYQQRVIQNLADTVEVTGEITVAPTDIGKVADIFIYAAAHFPWDANNTYYYTVGEGYSVSPWDQDPYKLVPFIPNVTLGVSHHVSMWKGTFPVTGTLDIFFGYRLPNGILVSNKQPIEATIQ